MKHKIDELRIIICGLLFAAISRIAPIDTVEGDLTVDICLEWSDRIENALNQTGNWRDE